MFTGALLTQWKQSVGMQLAVVDLESMPPTQLDKGDSNSSRALYCPSLWLGQYCHPQTEYCIAEIFCPAHQGSTILMGWERFTEMSFVCAASLLDYSNREFEDRIASLYKLQTPPPKKKRRQLNELFINDCTYIELLIQVLHKLGQNNNNNKQEQSLDIMFTFAPYSIETHFLWQLYRRLTIII